MSTIRKLASRSRLDKESVVAHERYAFVIRLWNESDDSSGSQQRAVVIRGSIHTSQSGRIYYFDSLEKIPELLKEITGWETNSK